LPAAGLVLGLLAGSLPGAGEAENKVLDEIDRMIVRDHKIKFRPPHAQAKGSHANAASGKQHAAAETSSQHVDRLKTDYMHLVQRRNGKKAQVHPAINLSKKSKMSSQVITVGNAPNGFGTEFDWDRTDPQVLLAVFVNAADSLGVSITGLKQGDQIQVTSAAGVASFSQDTGNPTASGIIGVLAAGAIGVLNATGNPEFDPVVTAAEQFAQSEFKGTGNADKYRDAFGTASDGGTAQEEGGVEIALPGSGGPWYSSDHDHRDGWASLPTFNGGPRGLPKTVVAEQLPLTPFGFVGRRGNNTFVCQQDGEAYILAWDFAYRDNAGFYKLVVTLTQASAVPPGPPIFKGKANRTPAASDSKDR
jgi:hypothetical protein